MGRLIELDRASNDRTNNCYANRLEAELDDAGIVAPLGFRMHVMLSPFIRPSIEPRDRRRYRNDRCEYYQHIE